MKGIEKLEIGKEYKYKELCDLFGEVIKTSNSKNSQLKIWKSFFRWSNPTTQKYKIEEIYPEQLPIEDGRVNNGGNSTSKYLILDDMLMDYLDENNKISTTMADLAVKLGILTEQYYLYRNDNEEFCENNNIPKDLINELLLKISGCVLRSLRSAVERLNSEGYIKSCSFFTLVLVEGGKVELSEKKSLEIKALEDKVLKRMGIDRFEMLTKGYKEKFYNIVKEELREIYGYNVWYYYRKYDITKLTGDYNKKSTEDRWRLSRKFIITIGTSMLKMICELNDDDVYNQTDLIREVILLINYFFVYMHHVSWDAYWNEDELDWNNDKKAMLFWSQYCLVEVHDYSEKQRELNQEKIKLQNIEDKERAERRKEAIESLGEEDVLEYEYILPDLDWKKVFDVKGYAELIVESLNQYYKWKDTMIYCDDRYIEEYGLYIARLWMDGRQDEQVPLYEFDISLLDEL